MIKHCLASEAVLGALADRLGEDRVKWSLAGLAPRSGCGADPGRPGRSRDGKRSGYWRKTGWSRISSRPSSSIMRQACGEKGARAFHHALAAGETITGLIIATALVYPDKKLASVKPKSIVKRMKEKAFAASVNRDIIPECEVIGIPRPEFAENRPPGHAIDQRRPGLVSGDKPRPFRRGEPFLSSRHIKSKNCDTCSALRICSIKDDGLSNCSVSPVKTGVRWFYGELGPLDAGLRRNDGDGPPATPKRRGYQERLSLFIRESGSAVSDNAGLGRDRFLEGLPRSLRR